MTHLDLSAREVTAVRRVLSADDPDFERRMRFLLLALSRLIPCDRLGFAIIDRAGFLEYGVGLPDNAVDRIGAGVCHRGLHGGVEQLVGRPSSDLERAGLAALGLRDRLRICVGLDCGRVALLFFDRRARCFEPRHVEIVSMLQPALARLVRPPGRTLVLAGLSGAERQVLELVALGATNRDVADRLSVSEATVRKHLEHAYRKLGVSNRTAAAALVHVAAGDLVAPVD
jgi:DNA-binding CsgD family transcriptional regulator